MKKLVLVMVVLLFSDGLFALNGKKDKDCNFDEKILVTNNAIAKSIIIADSYWWEISQGSSKIIGNNKTREVKIDFRGESVLRLVRFKEGLCSVSCVKLKELNPACCNFDFSAYLDCHVIPLRLTNVVIGELRWHSLCEANISKLEVNLSEDVTAGKGAFENQSSFTLTPPFKNQSFKLHGSHFLCDSAVLMSIKVYYKNGCETKTFYKKVVVETKVLKDNMEESPFSLGSLNAKKSAKGFEKESVVLTYNQEDQRILVVSSNIRVPLTLEVFDLSGILVLSSKVSSSKIVDVSNLKSGVYFYTLKENSTNLSKGKFVVKKR